MVMDYQKTNNNKLQLLLLLQRSRALAFSAAGGDHEASMILGG